MRLVILESPYAGDVEANEAYARRCMKDCLQRGEAPFASHLMYTQPGVLDDTDPAERALGIRAGLQWAKHADAAVVYTDRGVSDGMKLGIARHEANGVPVEYRALNGGLNYWRENREEDFWYYYRSCGTDYDADIWHYGGAFHWTTYDAEDYSTADGACCSLDEAKAAAEEALGRQG